MDQIQGHIGSKRGQLQELVGSPVFQVLITLAGGLTVGSTATLVPASMTIFLGAGSCSITCGGSCEDVEEQPTINNKRYFILFAFPYEYSGILLNRYHMSFQDLESKANLFARLCQAQARFTGLRSISPVNDAVNAPTGMPGGDEQAMHLQPKTTTRREAAAILNALPPATRAAVQVLEVHNDQVLVRFQPGKTTQNAYDSVMKTVRNLQMQNVLPGNSYQVVVK